MHFCEFFNKFLGSQDGQSDSACRVETFCSVQHFAEHDEKVQPVGRAVFANVTSPEDESSGLRCRLHGSTLKIRDGMYLVVVRIVSDFHRFRSVSHHLVFPALNILVLHCKSLKELLLAWWDVQGTITGPRTAASTASHTASPGWISLAIWQRRKFRCLQQTNRLQGMKKARLCWWRAFLSRNTE